MWAIMTKYCNPGVPRYRPKGQKPPPAPLDSAQNQPTWWLIMRKIRVISHVTSPKSKQASNKHEKALFTRFLKEKLEKTHQECRTVGGATQKFLLLARLSLVNGVSQLLFGSSFYGQWGLSVSREARWRPLVA